MKKKELSGLKTKVILYISVAMSLFVLFVVIATSIVQHKRLERKQSEFHDYINATIEYVLDEYTRKYLYITRRIITADNVVKFMKEKNHQGLYEIFEKKWKLLQEE
jgi:hypothetical protein